MPRATVRDGTLTVKLPDRVKKLFDIHDGDELEVTSERGRLILSLTPERASADEVKALEEAEAEFAKGKTRRLDDVLNGLGRKAG